MPSRLPPDLDLAAAAGVAVATAAIVTVWRTSLLRPILGLLFVAFVPGYAVVSALFPGFPAAGRRERKDEGGSSGPGRSGGVPWAERVALSVGTSVSLVIVLAFTLDAVSPGLDIHWIVRALTAVTVAGCLVAWIRRRYKILSRLQRVA